MMRFKDVISFHGHACPGLALGYRVSEYVLKEFSSKPADEELVAIVENDSCAVDAVQVMTGCTFGKGNLIFKDYGKQVYTFLKRNTREAMRISIQWKAPEESEIEKQMWRRYSEGDRSPEVIKVVHERKSKKIKAIMEAAPESLFKITYPEVSLPEKARVYPSLICNSCGEKVMEPRARVKDGKIVCIPCSWEGNEGTD